MFKGAGDCFQADTVCDCGRTYFFIYCNDDITDSKYYLFVSRERVIWRLKRPKKYWNHVYMDYLYNKVKLWRAAYMENKLLHGTVRTHVQGVAEEIIQHEVKGK